VSHFECVYQSNWIGAIFQELYVQVDRSEMKGTLSVYY